MTEYGKSNIVTGGDINANSIMADTVIVIAGKIHCNSIRATNVIQMPYVVDGDTYKLFEDWVAKRRSE